MQINWSSTKDLISFFGTLLSTKRVGRRVFAARTAAPFVRSTSISLGWYPGPSGAFVPSRLRLEARDHVSFKKVWGSGLGLSILLPCRHVRRSNTGAEVVGLIVNTVDTKALLSDLKSRVDVLQGFTAVVAVRVTSQNG